MVLSLVYMYIYMEIPLCLAMSEGKFRLFR